MTTGIHHVTAITANVQRNVDFYVGFLGLRLVKQTGGYEDARQLHLFYGDPLGSPGSLVTFLVWEAGARGRTGLGVVSEIAFSVPQDSMGDWLTRAITAGIPVTGPTREMGEAVLRLRDPDGIVVKLVGMEMPPASAPHRIHSVTILTEDARQTADFIARFGYAEASRDGPFLRMRSDTDFVDIRASKGFVPAIPGTGMFDHVAFRANNVEAVQAMRLALKGHEGVTNVHDRKYFLSLYVREPMGTLLEYATDGPGFAVDEAPDDLGGTLMIPPQDNAQAEDLRVMLPQFALPGAPRIPMRDLPFIHRFHVPNDPDDSAILLLHGSGGDESDLMPLAHRLNPRARLLGVRGRSNEEGVNRWFRRLDATRYDQSDIRAEAEAFADFIASASRAYGLNPERLLFLGYSNGANLLAAFLRLQPGLVKRAILLRAVDVLDDPPSANLPDVRILLITGQDDPLAEKALPLEPALRMTGADLVACTIPAGHDISAEDLDRARVWLAAD
ncbi:VOC family protein [Paracoccus ravus]|uniref:VOC family protein n=1 Tax=Paracoccus ravus TaxID=2447760 RepID=UPI00106DEEBC|nr:VOC family protein [Paracoccus ravus]